MATTSHDSSSVLSLSPVRVDVRLCGSIPRRDITEQLVHRGAPCPLGDLTSSDLNASGANSSSSERPTHLKAASAFDGLADLVSQHPSMARIRCDSAAPPQQLPVFEPPSWAVPAQGEARLEVCLALAICYACSCVLFRTSRTHSFHSSIVTTARL